MIKTRCKHKECDFERWAYKMKKKKIDGKMYCEKVGQKEVWIPNFGHREHGQLRIYCEYCTELLEQGDQFYKCDVCEKKRRRFIECIKCFVPNEQCDEQSDEKSMECNEGLGLMMIDSNGIKLEPSRVMKLVSQREHCYKLGHNFKNRR